MSYNYGHETWGVGNTWGDNFYMGTQNVSKLEILCLYNIGSNAYICNVFCPCTHKCDDLIILLPTLVKIEL